MTPSTEEFAHRHNVRNYTLRLREAPDDARRKLLTSLLAEERAKAAAAGWLSLPG